MEKESNTLINYNTNASKLHNTDNYNKIKIKPIKLLNKNKIIFNLPSILKQKNIQKEISTSLFQENEVSLVRNLNIDEEKNFCESKTQKEILERNRLNEGEYLGSSSNIKTLSLPKIKAMTSNTIIESEKRLNENKKINRTNMTNSLLEKELYDNLKDIQKKINQLKVKKSELYKDFVTNTKEIKEIKMEMEAEKVIHGQSILNKFTSKPSSSMTISRIENGKKMRDELTKSQNELRTNSENNFNIKKVNSYTTKEIKHLWDKGKYEDKMNKLKLLYSVKKEKDEERNEKIAKIERLTENLKLIENNINVINKDLVNFRTKEKEIIEKLMRHYEALLYGGRDTRNDGLIWIIRAMWNLGKNVPMQYIPTFLDFDAIDFLFKLANKSILLENERKLLNDIKKNLMLKVHKLYFNSNNKNNKNKGNDDSLKKIFQGNNERSSLIFKTNLIKRNSILKHSVSQTNIVKSYIHSSVDDEQRDKEKKNFKEISKIFEIKKNNMNLENMQGMETIATFQKKIKSIENEIIEMKNKEIIRIFKQFIENDYKNKYHVSIDVVLAALVGEHMKNIEMNKYFKFKKEYYENLKTIRFFEYGKKKESK